MKLARRMNDSRKKYIVTNYLVRIVIGVRLPNLYKYQKEMNIFECVNALVDIKIFDPVLSNQRANRFALIKLLPEYLPLDQVSGRNATFLNWSKFQYQNNNSEQLSPNYFRVEAVQCKIRTLNNFNEFVTHCEYFMDVASEYCSDFVLFPELLSLLLLSFLPKDHPSKSSRRLSEFTSRYVELFNQSAIKYNINNINGSHSNVENDSLYNLYYLFHRDGTICKKYKMQITPSKKKWWGVNDRNPVEIFDTGSRKIKISISYDVHLPELARIAVSKGAQFYFVTYNTDERRGYLRVHYCTQKRAIEIQINVTITGCVGNLPNYEHLDIDFSQAVIFTPTESGFSREGIATEATPNTETVIYQELELGLLKRNRQFGSVQPWNDQRSDLYEVIQKRKKVLKELVK